MLYNILGSATTSTLVISYYHGLLMRKIDADLLIDRMCAVELLTTHEQMVISSGHSVHHKNWLLLEYVRYMDPKAVMTFFELVKEIWPQVGLQLITGM